MFLSWTYLESLAPPSSMDGAIKIITQDDFLKAIYCTLSAWNDQWFWERLKNQEKVKIALQKMHRVMLWYKDLPDTKKILAEKEIKQGVRHLLHTFWNAGVWMGGIRRDVIALLEMYNTMNIQTEAMVFREYALQDTTAPTYIKAFEEKT